MRLPHPIYGLYERRLASSLPRAAVPRHIGVILDGNRRWARSLGADASTGHRRGADKIADLLGWSEEVGVEVVTLWMLSTDNLSRSPEELRELLGIICDAVTELASARRWRLQVMGALELLPPEVAQMLRDAERTTAQVEGLHVNVAVGYGGRQEIVDAVRSLLRAHGAAGTLAELAETFDVDHIAAHLLSLIHI